MLYFNKKTHIFSGEREMSGENGFTLIEILIAISIFAIGLLAVAALQITAFNGNRLGDEVTKATTLAQTQVEVLKGADFNSAALAPGNYVDPNNPINPIDPATGVAGPGARFNRTWTIANNTAFSRRVDVKVFWTTMGLNDPNAVGDADNVTNGFGDNRRVVMSTLTRGGGF